MTARFARMLAPAAAIGIAAVVHTATPAAAIGPTTFSMSPASGPAGTEVSVGGAGCAPGLLLSSSLDRVVVTMASAPPVSVQIPVTSGGTWSGTVTVPANAAAAPAVVTVLCFTDGLQSLLTIYTPKTFTITAAAAPKTTPVTTTVPEAAEQPPAAVPPVGGPTPTTRPGSPPTTRPDAGGPVAGGPVAGGPDAGGPDAGGPGGGATAPGGGSSVPGSADPERSTATGAPRSGSAARHADTLSVAADLRSPSLTDNATGGDHGLRWIGWLAILLLLAGLTAGALLYRRSRPEDAAAE
jgi:hypothetical protein